MACGSEVHAVAMTEDTLITGDAKGTVALWSVTTGDTILSMSCEGNVWGLAVRGEGQGMRVATGDSSGAAKLWDGTDGSLLHEMKCAGAVRCIDMDTACQIITTGCSTGEARVR